MMEGISVIVPTLNRDSYLVATIKCLLKQDFEPPYEIIVVDQSSHINSTVVELEQKSHIIKYYHILGFRGLPEARNFGVQHAKYDFILFLDDDIMCDDKLLKEHYKYLIKKEIGVVAGGITEKFRTELKVNDIGKFCFFSCAPKTGFHIKHSGYVDHAKGANYSIKKNVFLEVGGVDEYLSLGVALLEETELCLRVKERGYKVYFNYNAHVWHLAADTGGCRVVDIEKYVQSFVHNQALVISRHLKWYHYPTAFFCLFRRVISLIISYHKPSLFILFLRSCKCGFRRGKLKPKYTDFRGKQSKNGY